jgi:hypothetical protein
MRALYNRVRTKDPTWKLAGFIVDDPLADVLTIRLVDKSITYIPSCIWITNTLRRMVENNSMVLIGL